MTLAPRATFAEVMFRVAWGTVHVAVVPIGSRLPDPNQKSAASSPDDAALRCWSLSVAYPALPPVPAGSATAGPHAGALYPHVLAQCDAFLREHGLTPIAAPDAAGSARRIRERGRRGVAAIASARVADRYRLAILTEISRPAPITAPVLPFSAQPRWVHERTTHCSVS